MRRFLLGFLLGVLALPLTLALAACLDLFPINSNTSPRVWESTLAHMALNASATHHAPHIANPIAPPTKI